MKRSETLIANARRLLDGRPKSELARKAGIERTKLYRFLNGKQMLRADELQSLADVLDVDVTAFYGTETLKPDFQAAFMTNDDFALRISGLLLGPEERHPAKETTELETLLADVEIDPEAEMLVTDLCDVLRSPALSAFAFIGAWTLLWERMTVDEGIHLAKALRRVAPPQEGLLIRAASIYYRRDAERIDRVSAFLASVPPEPAYLNGIGHLRHILSMQRIDQAAGLAHKVLDKHRRRTQESVHRRFLNLKRTIDRPDAPQFWARLLTHLDPNIP